MRKNIGAELPPHNVQGNATEKRANIKVSFKLNAVDHVDSPLGDSVVEQNVSLYGPGDVLGFHASRIILKKHPVEDDGNFLTNYVPYVEFKEPDFPWRYSANKVDGKWIPWINLVVFKMKEHDKEGEFTEDRFYGSGLPRRIKLTPSAKLPNLQESWRWAHVKCVEEKGIRIEALKEKIKQNKINPVARLFCSRVLEPYTKYAAFIIPTYLLGIESALGMDSDTTQTNRSDLSWEGNGFDANHPIAISGLPYYHKWEFRTGSKGDFEQLARKIEASRLENLGGRKVNLGDIGYGIMGAANEIVEVDGVLRTSDYTPVPTNVSTREQLKDLLNQTETGVNTNRVLPPIYGRWINHFAMQDVDLDHMSNNWMDELNLELRYRLAAGLGVQYVKENQEDLMNAAWEQLERVQEENQKRNIVRMGREVSKCFDKRIKQISDPIKFLSFTGPVSTKVRISDASVPRSNRDTVSPAEHSLFISKTINSAIQGSSFANTSLDFKSRKYKKNLVVEGSNFRPPAFEERIAKNRIVKAIDNGHMAVSSREWDLPVANEGTFLDLGELVVQVERQVNPEETIQRVFVDADSVWNTWQNQVKTIPAAESDDPINPVMAGPEFNTSMYKYLLDLSEEYFLPGLTRIPQNSVTALETNRPFIEAFMIGLNHEFALELRWRGYPTDMRGSYFRKFWESTIYSIDDQEKMAFRSSELGIQLKARFSNFTWEKIEQAFFYLVNEADRNLADAYEEAIEEWISTREEGKDIRPLHHWGKRTPLGSHGVSTKREIEELVVLIRAELIRKFPNTFVYLVPKVVVDGEEAPKWPKTEEDYKELEYPVFEANLPPDILLLGFPFNSVVAKTYFVVFEERSSEIQLGLDAERIKGFQGTKLENLSWAHFPLDSIANGYLDDKLPTQNDAANPQRWNRATYIARAFTQRPLRVAIDLNTLLP